MTSEIPRRVLLASIETMSGKADVLSLLKLVNQATHDALAAYESKGQDVPQLASLDEQTLSTMSDDLALKKAIRLLEGACDQLCATLAPPANTVINVSAALSLPSHLQAYLRERVSEWSPMTGHACA